MSHPKEQNKAIEKQKRHKEKQCCKEQKIKAAFPWLLNTKKDMTEQIT